MRKPAHAVRTDCCREQREGNGEERKVFQTRYQGVALIYRGGMYENFATRLAA